MTNREESIAAQLVTLALNSGYNVSVFDGEEWALKRSQHLPTILQALASTDSDTLVFRNPAVEHLAANGVNVGERVGSVTLIWGNDLDLISDYAAKDLDAFGAWLKPVTDWVEALPTTPLYKVYGQPLQRR